MDRIEVWFDRTSDCSDPAWCVSLCADDGDEIEYIASYASRERAVRAGIAAAAYREISAVIRDADGRTVNLGE